MASVIPAHDQARRDRRLLRGHALRVYFWLHERLDVVEFRRVKLSSVVRGTSIEKSSAADAVNRLVTLGYLIAKPSIARGREYRLSYSVVDHRSE